MPFLLPIIPAGAKLSAHTSLDQGKLGKIPGRQIGDGWAGFRQWQSFTADPQALEAWGRMYTEDKLPETIGLQAKELPACDVDVEDEQAAALVEVTAGIFLGRAPKRSRPNRCKFLLQYRLRPGAERIKKRRLVFRHPEHPDKGMAVEILGDGQQYLIEGKHPSGVLYQWDDGQGPLQWGYDSLTQIDKQAVDKFLGAIQEVLLANGYELVGGSAVPPKGDAAALSRPVDTAVPPRSSAPPEEHHPIGPDHPDRAPSLELLAELLEHCPCDATQFASRDDWFRMLCAIKAACAGDDTFYRERVWPWCQAYPKNRENYVRNVWDSIYETSLGWSYLTGVAGDFGWSGWLSAYLTPIELDDETVGSDDTARPNSTRHAPVPKLMPQNFALQKLPRRQFVLGNRFMAGVVTLGVGPPGAAKSTLSILTALSIASGERLTGEVVHCQGKVWIHNNEDSLDELYRRTGGILKYHGIDLTTVRENIFVTSGLDEPLVVAIKEKDLVRRQQAVAEVIKSIKKKGIQHIAVDPFVSTHRGVSENSNEEIEQVVDCFRAVAHETGCSIDLIHHSLKPQNKSSEALAGDMNAARGASSLAGAVRMLYTVLPMGKKTAEDMNVPGDLAARLVRLDLYRSNGSHTAVTGAPLCTSGPKKDAWAKRRSCRDPTNRSTALVVSISLSAPK